MSIDLYIDSLASYLAPASVPDDLTEELRAHLEDAARDLQMAGFSPDESEQEAIRRFGTPHDVAAALARAAARPRRWHPRTVAAALLIAITLVGLGGSAVASANTPATPDHLPASVQHASMAARGSIR